MASRPAFLSHVVCLIAAVRSRCVAAAACLAVLGCCLCGADAFGQWGGYGYNRGGGYASTAQQAAAYGYSAMMRAQGQENLMNSAAAKNWEQAKTMEIQNRLRWTETYFEMRKVNKEARAAEAGPRVTQDQAIRMAQSSLPPRLGSTELDPVTGHIDYPIILTQDIYDEYRRRLDTLFAHRAAAGGSIQYNDLKEIETTVSKFIDTLKEHVREYAGGDYGRARTFLESLVREAKMPAG